MNSYVTLSFVFSSAHFYAQSKWSDEHNADVFGRCFTKHGHGHNYKLLVKLETQGLDVSQEEKEIQSLVLELDHEHLNHRIPYFHEKIPTTENIALYLKEKMMSLKFYERIHSFRLYEMEDLWVQIQMKA